MKYNIVSGLRRSGTSLMMLLIRQSGIPISGIKYPTRLENGQLSCIPTIKGYEANPNGYWELGTVSVDTGIREEAKYIGMDGDFVKVLSDVFYFSDKNYIDKSIVMLREPRKILSSFLDAGIISQDKTQPTIEKLALDLFRTIEFLEDNKKEYLIVDFEELLIDTRKIMNRVYEMVGADKDNFKKIENIVDRRIDRRQPLSDKKYDFSAIDNIYKKYTKLK